LFNYLSVFVWNAETVFIDEDVDESHSQDVSLKALLSLSVVYAQNDKMQVQTFIEELFVYKKIIIKRWVKNL